MNSLPTTTAAIQPLDIGDVRIQIDSIDRQIAALLVQRGGLSASVAAAKQAAGNKAFGWRPAREVEILRSVMLEQASLDPKLAFCVWRALISANLAAQGDLVIVTTDGLKAAVKATFSVGTTPAVVITTGQVLDEIMTNDHAIGVLPWPDRHGGDNDWWVKLMASKYDGLYVCAASPIAGGEPEIMLIAARAPEAAGDDISLIAGPIGAFEGGVMAQMDGVELVACGEFIDPNMPLPAGCRLIGSFALA